MSNLVSTFATEKRALSALAEIQQHSWGNGQVLGPAEDAQKLLAQQLFVTQREAQKTVSGGVIGALSGVALVYLHHAGILPLTYFAPLFGGGRYPAYLAVGGAFGLVAAILSSVYSLTLPHYTLPPKPCVLLTFAPRPQLQKVRQVIARHGGHVL